MQKHIIVCLCLITLNFFLWPSPKPMIEPIYQQASLPEIYQVDISGAVVFPGRYYFYYPVTIERLILYAGGHLDDADLAHVNLRMTLNKHAEITIPFIKTSGLENTTQINLNQANFKTLYDLPYITETIALSILMYREQYGPFQHVDELLNVKHIGPATLEKIKDYFILG